MKKRILIIDDYQDILEILQDILIYAGYAVTTLIEIDNIIETVAKYKPDLVIIDFLLQGINGGELCSQIKKNEQTHHIPVILMSAHSRILDSFEIFKCDEFIEKPFDRSHLVDRIKYHLKRSAPRDRHKEYIKVEFNKN